MSKIVRERVENIEEISVLLERSHKTCHYFSIGMCKWVWSNVKEEREISGTESVYYTAKADQTVTVTDKSNISKILQLKDRNTMCDVAKAVFLIGNKIV